MLPVKKVQKDILLSFVHTPLVHASWQCKNAQLFVREVSDLQHRHYCLMVIWCFYSVSLESRSNFLWSIREGPFESRCCYTEIAWYTGSRDICVATLYSSSIDMTCFAKQYSFSLKMFVVKILTAKYYTFFHLIIPLLYQYRHCLFLRVAGSSKMCDKHISAKKN